MGFFNWGKKQEPEKEQEQQQQEERSVIIAMPMFSEQNAINGEQLKADFQTYWGETIEIDEEDEENESENTLSFNVRENWVIISEMNVPIPSDDIKSTADYTYIWENALEECSQMKSHAIVTIMNQAGDQVDTAKLLTKVLISILRTSSSAIGVYKGSQTMLIPKELYLSYGEQIKEDNELPINLWTYIGLRQEENNTFSAYTFGLSELFGHPEIEIISSAKEPGELHGFISMMANYVVNYRAELKHGETIGFSEDHKIPIELSDGKYIGEQTIKLVGE